MVIQNMVMKFSNFDISYHFCLIFDLSSTLVCRVESIHPVGIIIRAWLLCDQYLFTSLSIKYHNKNVSFLFVYNRTFPLQPTEGEFREAFNTLNWADANLREKYHQLLNTSDMYVRCEGDVFKTVVSFCSCDESHDNQRVAITSKLILEEILAWYIFIMLRFRY